ncbi:D-2-hydroxyacid dehydrogenase [Pseudovibrio sp. JE062]|uniref:D-2-hydroxyacid dehydrogenase n=1 Tax=Pseudovibrio sp. JE062 TaxID=439495 RepID=UPI000186C1BC|nr:D-2-hydroxyacid dehydrogenase [Pseudovibrio sp. JE062]EEA94684.1 phosphoglycerate dehydrogenase [Pseudovibrio sp. JE062]
MKIAFLDRSTIGPTVQISKPSFEHEWVEYDNTSPDEVLERLQGVQICITNKVPLSADVLKQLPDLKLICIAATGYDKVDIATCDELGIVVSNVRGYAVNTVPEHAFALIFALRRSLVGYRQDVINGEWQKSGKFCFFHHPIKDLAGSRLGIIGSGTLGKGTARIGEALGMDVVFADRKGASEVRPGYTDWQEVITTSDVISLHTPLTPETRGMISTAEFEAMQQKPILINTSRGGLVDEAALVQALDKQQIAAAGFDVLTTEPPQADNPLLSILDRPNVIVTPHVAWASEEAMQTLWDQLVSHMENFQNGIPTNAVGRIGS